jgi:hypothetical protein
MRITVFFIQRDAWVRGSFSTMNVLSGIVSFGIMNGDSKVLNINVLNFPRADGAKRRARVLIPPGYLHPGKQKH